MDLDILDSKLEFKSFISSLAGLSSLELMNNSKELLKKFIELYRAATGDKEWPISFYFVFFEMSSKEDYRSKEGYRSLSFIDKEWFNKVELREDMMCSVGIDVPLQGGHIFLSYLLTACGSSHVMDKTFSIVRIFLAPACFSEFNTQLMDLLRELDLA